MRSKVNCFEIDAKINNEFGQDFNTKQTLFVLFGSPDVFKKNVLFPELKNKFPKASFVGCSTAGEISHTRVSDHSLTVAALQFDKTEFNIQSMPISDPGSSRPVGKQLAENLQRDDLKYVFILSDGLLVNGTDLVQGFRDVVGNDVIITGGLAGDGTDFSSTWVIDNKLLTKSVVAVGFYGDSLQIAHGTQGGWDSFGPERVITRSEGNVLYEIDNQPALFLYKKYLGEHVKNLPSSALLFPLGLKTANEQTQVVRTILSVDEKTQSMTFAGDIPEGWHTQFMRANFESLIDGAQNAAEQTIASFPTEDWSANDDDLFIMAISCVGRRLVLGEYVDDELNVVMDKVPKHAQMAGFYSYGEISPSGILNCELHNQTMTLTALRENK